MKMPEAFEKLRRAEQHAADLNAQIGAWVASRSQVPLPFTVEFDEQQSRFVYRVGDFQRALSPDWPLIIGDALTNFRAALDYAAWQLVATGQDPQPKRPHMIQFPLIWRWSANEAGHDRFVSELHNRLPGVDQRLIDILERHQPYEWAKHDASLRVHAPTDYYVSNLGRVERHPLALLDRLSNHDKHRKLQVVEELGVHVYAEVIDHLNCEVLSMVPIERNRLDPHAEVLHIYVRRMGPDKPKVKVSLSIDIVPAFGAEIAVEPAIEPGLALEVIGHEVRATLDDIEAAL